MKRKPLPHFEVFQHLGTPTWHGLDVTCHASTSRHAAGAKRTMGNEPPDGVEGLDRSNAAGFKGDRLSGAAPLPHESAKPWTALMAVTFLDKRRSGLLPFCKRAPFRRVLNFDVLSLVGVFDTAYFLPRKRDGTSE